MISAQVERAKTEALSLGLKVLLAGLQVLAIMAFIAMHRALVLVAGWLMPELKIITNIVESVLAAGFAVISLQLTFDMVVLFVPALRIMRIGRYAEPSASISAPE